MFLIENTIKWFEKNQNIYRLFTKIKFILTYIIIDNFRIVFYNAFSSKKIEISFILFEIKFIKLYQRFNELLSIYYKKTYNFIKNVNIKNRSISISIFFELNFLKSIFLNIVLRAFIRELINHEIYKKIIRDIT